MLATGHTSNRKQSRQAGFTVVEVLVVVTITLVLFALTTINLGQTQTTTTLTATTNKLLADMKSQQLLAMTGSIGNTSSQQPQGVYVQSGSYTLFSGTSYSSGNPGNFAVQLNSAYSLSTTLPSSQAVFAKGDGSVSSFSAGNNTITVSGNGSSKTLTINRFGAITVN